MSLGEFELIRHYFSEKQPSHAETLLGIGDDAALIRWPFDGEVLAVTVDTLVEGVHFLPGTDPERLGHKALAVNLSDLAAMGARPRWVTLALTLPEANACWLEAFSQGFFRLARCHAVELIGGDTTRGPLSISVQAMGSVPANCPLKRAGAASGDGIYLSGQLGSAGLGLKMLLGQTASVDAACVLHQEQPEPRVALGLALRGLASACIDVTDGLAADLGHILTASAVGAELVFEDLPLAPAVQHHIETTGDWMQPLLAGDDYELCFTLPACHEPRLRELCTATPCTRIGRIVESASSSLQISRAGQPVTLPRKGYEHF